MSEEIEKLVKDIYSDAWRAYDEYRVSHDMAQYNKRVVQLKKKYGNEGFLTNVLCSFAPIIYTLHAEYLMDQDGRNRN